MPNAFDLYREALVVDTKTVWPDDLPAAPHDALQRERIAGRLHAEPAKAAELEYVRLHTGFVREITVTAADLQRLAMPPENRYGKGM